SIVPSHGSEGQDMPFDELDEEPPHPALPIASAAPIPSASVSSEPRLGASLVFIVHKQWWERCAAGKNMPPRIHVSLVAADSPKESRLIAGVLVAAGPSDMGWQGTPESLWAPHTPR